MVVTSEALNNNVNNNGSIVATGGSPEADNAICGAPAPYRRKHLHESGNARSPRNLSISFTPKITRRSDLES